MNLGVPKLYSTATNKPHTGDKKYLIGCLPIRLVRAAHSLRLRASMQLSLFFKFALNP